MKKIGCIGHDCAACATREKLINKLKQDVERWKSRATTYRKQAEKLRDGQRAKVAA
jgi:chaperonin cofactor prefoldin